MVTEVWGMVTEALDMVTAGWYFNSDQANGAWRTGTWRTWYMTSMNIVSIDLLNIYCSIGRYTSVSGVRHGD